MLGGDIHEELMKTNDRTTQQSIEDLIDLICGGLDMMATASGNSSCRASSATTAAPPRRCR
jgi:hypothetical protein